MANKYEKYDKTKLKVTVEYDDIVLFEGKPDFLSIVGDGVKSTLFLYSGGGIDEVTSND